jgi:drug/metabolite transporter (DMT)-like permease
VTGSLLTALFFGITPVCAGRAIRLIGVLRANLYRLLVALVALGLWAFTLGDGFSGPFGWFFAAGAIGFGLGGMAMFQALPRLGAPLASLIVESGAAVSAAILAWFWLNDSLTIVEIVFCTTVLCGVSVGLLPYIRRDQHRNGARGGVPWIILAAVSQGFSLTLTRRAILGMKEVGETVHLPTAAFQRLVGGACIACLVLMLLRRRRPHTERAEPAISPHYEKGITRRPWFWVGLNALFGPILGVTCMVWALESLRPGVAQTVAATAPMISVPFARWLEGHRPPLLYYCGGIVAIAGLAGIYLHDWLAELIALH